MKRDTITPAFVDLIPESLAEGTLYVSEQFALAVHRCCCGCGGEVVTPLSRAEWHLRRRGERISLMPSIGNWGFKCQSHYWIRDNRVLWERPMSAGQIARVRARDKGDKERHIAKVNTAKESTTREAPRQSRAEPANTSFASRVRRWFGI